VKKSDVLLAAAAAVSPMRLFWVAWLPSRSRWPSRFAGFALAASLAFGLAWAPFRAAEAAWEIVPDVSMFVATDDNVLVNENEVRDASSVVADAEVTFASYNERSQFIFAPRIVVDRYVDEEASEFDTQDTHLFASGSHVWERSAVGFRMNYADEIIINSELAEAIPDDPDLVPGEDFTDPDPATGRLTFFDNERARLELRGNVDLAIAERNQLRMEIRQQDVEYTGSVDAERSDFDNTAYSLALIREVDERNTVTARVTVSRFQVPANRNTTDSTLVEGSFTRPIAPTWMAYVTGGVQRSQYEFLRGGSFVENSAASTILTVGLRKRSERTRWNFDFSHNTQPWGNGYLAKRDNARVYVTHQFSQRFTGRAGVRFTKTTTLDDVEVNDDREYTRFDFGFEYALSPTMYLSGGYDFIKQEFVNEDDADGEKNAFYFGFTYRGLSQRAD
jgi:hypothetical protein